jgi:hypothetical protein
MGNDDENKQAILARRARYIAMAVAGISTATSATACVCLSPLPGDAGMDASPSSPPDAALPLPDTRVGPATDAAGDVPTDANNEDSAPDESDAP